MIAALQSWWLARSTREQRLIAVMLLLSGGMAVWFGVVVPVEEGLVRARGDHAVALERNASIRAGAALLKGGPATRGSVEGALDSRVAISAAEAGFTLDSNMAAGADTTAITIATARAPALLAWLDRLEQQGIAVDSLQLQPGTNGAISARATLKVRKP